MSTNILRLRKRRGPCTVKTDETWVDALAFVDPDNNPIPLDGIAWELLVRKSAASKYNALYGTLADYLRILPASPTVAIQAPGTEYAISEALTLPGGLVLQASRLGAGGALAAVSIKAIGSFDAIPTNPVQQIATSGAGNGAAFMLTFVRNAIAIIVPKGVMQGLTAGDYAYTLRASADGIDADIVSGTLTILQGTDD